MGFIEGFGFKIYRLRENRVDSEFLLYSEKKRTWSVYSEKRLYSILIVELRDLGVDVYDFARDKIKMELTSKQIDNLILQWIAEEQILIDNIGYMPSDDLTYEEDDKTYFNVYRRSKLLDDVYSQPQPQEHVFPNIEKLIKNLCGGSEVEYNYFIRWLGWIVQNPLKRLPTSIILQGEQGTGKSKFCELILKPIFAQNFCEIGQSDINKEYNDYILGKQIIVANEVIHNDNKFLVPDKLKNYVTDEFLSINRKFKDTIYVRNYSQWIFVTNNQVPLKIDNGDRRYSVFKSKKLVNGRDLINKLLDNIESELKQFLQFLLFIPVNYSDVDQPIDNEAKKELIKSSYNSVQEFIEEAKDLGGLDKVADHYGVLLRTLNINGKVGFLSSELYSVYTFFCADVGYNRSSKIFFSKNFSNHYNYKSIVEWIDNKSQRVLVQDGE